jgi:hypothetical protein
MASAVYLASMILMGVLALVVIAATATSRDWYSYTPEIGRPEVGGLTGLSQNPTAWVVAFFLVVGLALATVFSALSGGGTTLFLALAGLLLLSFVMIGVYAAGRSRGHPHAYAVGEVVITLGLLFLLVVSAYLLANFGA